MFCVCVCEGGGVQFYRRLHSLYLHTRFDAGLEVCVSGVCVQPDLSGCIPALRQWDGLQHHLERQLGITLNRQTEAVWAFTQNA